VDIGAGANEQQDHCQERLEVEDGGLIMVSVRADSTGCGKRRRSAPWWMRAAVAGGARGSNGGVGRLERGWKCRGASRCRVQTAGGDGGGFLAEKRRTPDTPASFEPHRSTSSFPLHHHLHITRASFCSPFLTSPTAVWKKLPVVNMSEPRMRARAKGQQFPVAERTSPPPAPQSTAN
jgi:hypothetical protein